MNPSDKRRILIEKAKHVLACYEEIKKSAEKLLREYPQVALTPAENANVKRLLFFLNGCEVRIAELRSMGVLPPENPRKAEIDAWMQTMLAPLIGDDPGPGSQGH